MRMIRVGEPVSIQPPRMYGFPGRSSETCTSRKKRRRRKKVPQRVRARWRGVRWLASVRSDLFEVAVHSHANTENHREFSIIITISLIALSYTKAYIYVVFKLMLPILASDYLLPFTWSLNANYVSMPTWRTYRIICNVRRYSNVSRAR